MPLEIPAPLRRTLRSGDVYASRQLLRRTTLDAACKSALEADLLRQSGAAEQAASALSIDDSSAPPAVRLASNRIRGELLGSTGRVGAALDLLERVIAEGIAAGEHEQVALAALSRFTLLAGHRSLADSQQALDTAKRAVLQSGDAQLMAALHARVGQAHGQRNLASLAASELTSALQILAPEPNASIEAFVHLALSGVEYLLSRNREAARAARVARSIAEQNGLAGLRAAAQANLAFLECRRGRFDQARSLASDSLALVPFHSLARGALLDTLANVAMSCGHLGEAEESIRHIEQIIEVLKGSTLLLVDSAPVRADLYRELGELAAAEALLNSARDAADQRGDTLSRAKITLLRSEVRAARGDVSGADDDIVDVVNRTHHPNAEVLGLLARARGVRASQAVDWTRATNEFKRALRVFAASGDRFHSLQTRRLRDKHLSPIHAGGAAHPRHRRRARLEFAESLTFGCALLPQPVLAANEIGRFCRKARVAAAFSVNLKAHSEITLQADQVVVGSVGDKVCLLELVPNDDTPSKETVAHVLQVVRLAASAHRAHLESTRKTLSWEIDVAPEGKKGLYISPVMKRLLGAIRRVAPTNSSVLITGETGTGKEVVAAEVHALSKQADKPFIALNVTAVPREMLEGQLFGYRRGAFTGAVADARGLIREAEGGTLFIDEIGELSADLQPKLLRFLESGEIQPLGERPQRVEVRIVAATNAHLLQLVEEGKFRVDLFYRLNVVSLAIPPLRERREEIPTLIHHFLTRHALDAGRPIPQLSPSALERLSAYDWPGNVRQLTNELKRIVALHDENELVDLKDLSAPIRDATPIRQTHVTAPVMPGTVTVRLDQPLQGMYDDVERAAIPRALKLARNNQTETASRLGITRKGLYLKRRRLGLDDDPE